MQFTPEVIKELETYVYRLVDPKNGETIYVGKGQGNRVFEHVAYSGGKKDDDMTSQLSARIQEIQSESNEVEHIIHRHGLNDHEALLIESALIEAYPKCLNVQSGHGSFDHGSMSAAKVIEKYQAPLAEFSDKVLLIKINRSAKVGRAGESEDERIYRAVRFSWIVSAKRARKVDYVLAVKHGLIVGAFVAEEWLEATAANFPEFGTHKGRHAFNGHIAPQEVVDRYVRKRIPKSRQGAANPIRYHDKKLPA